MNKTIRIKSKYKPLFKDSDKRYVLLTGGRNSAKSFTASLAEATALVQPVPHKTLYTRYTLSSAEISVIPEFQDKLEIANLSNQFHTTKSIITHRKTGNSIIFAGIKTSAGNQTAKLKSIPGLSRFVVDEAEEFRDEVAFDTIDFSVRSLKAPNRVTLIMNPQDINHFVWAKWFDGYTEYVNIDGTQIPISRHPDLIHIHTTYLDNLEHIPKNYFDKIMFLREHNRPKYEHLFLGKWQEKAEGVVFPNWVEGEFDTSLPYAYGLDYGFFPDPLAMVKVAVDNNAKRVYIHEELYQTQLSHGDTLRAIREIVKGDEMIIHDTSEPRLSYDLAGIGLNMQKAEKGPGSIAEGIKKMQDYTLVVTKESHNLKKELNLYVWNDRKSSTPIDAHNHCFVGETMIETIDGIKRIDSITTNDMVKTSIGYKRVLRRWNNGIKQIFKYSIQFDTFCLSLSCTNNHLIKTCQGWIQISQLKSGMTVYLSKSSMERHTSFIPKKDIFQEAQTACIPLFGERTMGMYQKDSISITKMKTYGITELKTWNALKHLSIYLSMLKNALLTIPNFFKGSTLPVLKKRLIGIKVMKAGNGIESMQEKYTAKEAQKLKSAKFAAIHTKQETLAQIDFAPINAKPLIEEKLALITKQGNALFVDRDLLLTDIVKLDVVAVVVEGSYETNVYDLTVDEQHEYFANGLLVHNCMDATRYCFTRLAEGTSMLGFL